MRPNIERKFTRSAGEMRRGAVRLLREKQPRSDQQLAGLITTLAREREDFDRCVSMTAVVDEKLTSIRAELQPSAYDLAIGRTGPS